MLARQVGTEGVGGDKLRGGRWLREQKGVWATVALRRSRGFGRLRKMKGSRVVVSDGRGRAWW